MKLRDLNGTNINTMRSKFNIIFGGKKKKEQEKTMIEFSLNFIISY